MAANYPPNTPQYYLMQDANGNTQYIPAQAIYNPYADPNNPQSVMMAPMPTNSAAPPPLPAAPGPSPVAPVAHVAAVAAVPAPHPAHDHEQKALEQAPSMGRARTRAKTENEVVVNFLATRKTYHDPTVDADDDDDMPPEQLMFFGLLTRDHFELIKAVLHLAYELFKVTMACLLTIFVPQSCKDSDGTSHLCSIYDVFSDLSDFQVIVMIINFGTLGVALLHFLLIYKREKLFIQFLDEDTTIADRNLQLELNYYPQIEQILYRVNVKTLVISVILLVGMLGNAVVSGIVVFSKDRYEGFRTVTVFLTNAFLILNVVRKAMWFSLAGMRKRLALSCTEFDPISYNTVDMQYRDQSIDKILKAKRLESGHKIS